MLVHAFDSILCVVQTALSVTHARRGKILSTLKAAYKACEAGKRSYKRTIVFYAWSKRRFQPRMWEV